MKILNVLATALKIIYIVTHLDLKMNTIQFLKFLYIFCRSDGILGIVLLTNLQQVYPFPHPISTIAEPL